MKSNDNPTVSLSLTVKDTSAALDFYTRAFGAEELFRMPTPDGGIAHAEFMIGNSHLYISDEAPDWHATAMPDGIMSSCLFAISTDNCDSSFRRAVEAGAQPLKEPEDQFWGTRSGMVKDPFGYRWSLSERIENVSPEELAKRAERFLNG